MTGECEGRVVWLVRHGNRRDFVDPEWLKTAERPHDGPLSADGEVQARETGERLARERIDHVFASPFIRAAQTASIIGGVIGRRVRIEPGLAEMLLDRWFPDRHDLLSAAELAEMLPGIDADYPGQVHPAYPEDSEAMLRRTAEVMRHLTGRYEGNLLLVAHGGSINGLARALAPSASVHTALCCLVRLAERAGAWVLEADGSDTSHLTQAQGTVRLA